MITTDKFKIPGRVINLDQARVQHGDKADHMVRMLAVGDPLADAVIVEMDAARSRRSQYRRFGMYYAQSPALWIHGILRRSFGAGRCRDRWRSENSALGISGFACPD